MSSGKSMKWEEVQVAKVIRSSKGTVFTLADGRSLKVPAALMKGVSATKNSQMKLGYRIIQGKKAYRQIKIDDLTIYFNVKGRETTSSLADGSEMRVPALSQIVGTIEKMYDSYFDSLSPFWKKEAQNFDKPEDKAMKLFLCLEAQKIAIASRSDEGIGRFKVLNASDKVKMVPKLNRSHTKASLEMSCRLAKLYLSTEREFNTRIMTARRNSNSGITFS